MQKLKNILQSFNDPELKNIKENDIKMTSGNGAYSSNADFFIVKDKYFVKLRRANENKEEMLYNYFATHTLPTKQPKTFYAEKDGYICFASKNALSQESENLQEKKVNFDGLLYPISKDSKRKFPNTEQNHLVRRTAWDYMISNKDNTASNSMFFEKEGNLKTVEFDYAVAKNGFGEKGMDNFFKVNVNQENFGGLAKVYSQIDTFKDNIAKFKNDEAYLANKQFYDGVISNVKVSINAFKSNYEKYAEKFKRNESYENQCEDKGKAVKLDGNQNTGWSR